MDKGVVMQQLALASLTNPAAAPAPAAAAAAAEPEAGAAGSAGSSGAAAATPLMTRSRAAAAANVLEAMLLRARALVRASRAPLPPAPAALCATLLSCCCLRQAWMRATSYGAHAQCFIRRMG